jgi:hypothetical protein
MADLWDVLALPPSMMLLFAVNQALRRGRVRRGASKDRHDPSHHQV